MKITVDGNKVKVEADGEVEIEIVRKDGKPASSPQKPATPPGMYVLECPFPISAYNPMGILSQEKAEQTLRYLKEHDKQRNSMEANAMEYFGDVKDINGEVLKVGDRVLNIAFNAGSKEHHHLTYVPGEIVTIHPEAFKNHCNVEIKYKNLEKVGDAQCFWENSRKLMKIVNTSKPEEPRTVKDANGEVLKVGDYARFKDNPKHPIVKITEISHNIIIEERPGSDSYINIEEAKNLIKVPAPEPVNPKRGRGRPRKIPATEPKIMLHDMNGEVLKVGDYIRLKKNPVFTRKIMEIRPNSVDTYCSNEGVAELPNEMIMKMFIKVPAPKSDAPDTVEDANGKVVKVGDDVRRMNGMFSRKILKILPDKVVLGPTKFSGRNAISRAVFSELMVKVPAPEAAKPAPNAIVDAKGVPIKIGDYLHNLYCEDDIIEITAIEGLTVSYINDEKKKCKAIFNSECPRFSVYVKCPPPKKAKRGRGRPRKSAAPGSADAPIVRHFARFPNEIAATMCRPCYNKLMKKTKNEAARKIAEKDQSQAKAKRGRGRPRKNAAPVRKRDSKGRYIKAKGWK